VFVCVCHCITLFTVHLSISEQYSRVLLRADLYHSTLSVPTGSSYGTPLVPAFSHNHFLLSTIGLQISIIIASVVCSAFVVFLLQRLGL
jgi:hypothetical protein